MPEAEEAEQQRDDIGKCDQQEDRIVFQKLDQGRSAFRKETEKRKEHQHGQAGTDDKANMGIRVVQIGPFLEIISASPQRATEMTVKEIQSMASSPVYTRLTWVAVSCPSGGGYRQNRPTAIISENHIASA